MRRPNNYDVNMALMLGPTDPNPAMDLSGLEIVRTVVQVRHAEPAGGSCWGLLIGFVGIAGAQAVCWPSRYLLSGRQWRLAGREAPGWLLVWGAT